MNTFVKEKSFYKNYFSLVFHIAIQNAIVQSLTITDKLILGTYNIDSFTGASLITPIQMLIPMGIGEVAMIFISRYWGKNDIQSIKKLISLSVRIALFTSLLFTLISFLMPEQIIGIFSDSPGIKTEGVKYLKIVCFSFVMLSLNSALFAILRSIETIKIGLIIASSTCCTNLLLNYVLIFGKFGFPELGVIGSALATLIARIIEFLIIVIYLKYFDKKIKLKLKDFLKIDTQLLKNFLKIGYPIIIANVMWGFAHSVYNFIFGHVNDKVALEAFSMYKPIFLMITVICFASPNAAAIMIGKSIGKGEHKNLKQYANSLQLLFLIIGVITSLAFLISKDFILGFLNASEEAKLLASQFIIIQSIIIIFTTYETSCFSGIMKSGGATRIILFNHLFFVWCITIPIACIAAFYFGASVLVIFPLLKLDQILKFIFAIFKINKGNWVRSLTQ